jgi:hypothetical protein
MPRYALSLITAVALIMVSWEAQAGSFMFGNGNSENEKSQSIKPEFKKNLKSSKTSIKIDREGFQFEGTFTTKSIEDNASYGHYLIVDLTRPDGEMQVKAIEEVFKCTGSRPKFGMTQKTKDGFKKDFYTVYYGPFLTAREAQEFSKKNESCFLFTIILAGVIQRF